MRSLVFAAAAFAALAALGTARAAPVTYRVDPTHAAVFYAVSHFGTSTNRGRFDVKGGTIEIDRAAKTGRVDITIDTAHIDSGVPALDEHLQSKDFFDSARYPTGRFTADKIGFDGDKVASVSGQLTLRGKTEPVTLTAEHFNCYLSPMFKRQVCGGDFKTTIKRSLWGIDWGLNFGFPDEVPLTIQVEAIEQS